MSLFTRQFTESGMLGLATRLRPLHARLVLLGLAALVTLAIGGAFRGLATFEEQVGSLGWLLNPSTVTEERISIIAIDEQSIAQLGPWPWSRATMAQLSAALTAAGVQMQLYDVVFPEEKEGDQAFLTSLQNTLAVLAQLPQLQADQGSRTGGLPTHAVAGLACSPQVNTAQGYTANADVFAPVPKGHITPLIDSDGAVRRVPAFVCIDGAAYPALAISALLTATRAEPWAATLEAGSSLLDPQKVLELPAYPGLSIPVDEAGNLRVSFRNAPQTYRAFSVADVINGAIDPALLENTWVLVGYTAFGLDHVPTPYNGAAHGVELQARILGSLLDNTVPYTPRSANLLLALLCVVFAGVLLLASARERLAGYGLPVCVVLLPLAAILLHAQLLSAANLWLGWLAPSIYGICAAGLLILHEYARVRLERSRVLSNLSSYLPIDVAQQIAYTLPNSSIDARRQDATLLSADLRNFSAYGEARPPEESAALLHFFFVKTTEIIEKHHGRVHEFKGDGLLAIWDGSGSQQALLALKAAEDMQRNMQDVLPQVPPAGLEPLALGIGIEQGPVLIGSIGPAHRRSHTLLGETVTITLRIQEMTAELAQLVLVGECAARQLSGHQLQSQGSYLLSGLKTPHILFAPPPDQSARRAPNPFLKLLHGGLQ